MRSLLLPTFFAGVVVGVPLVACGFPDISFAPSDEVAGDAGSAPTATPTPAETATGASVPIGSAASSSGATSTPSALSSSDAGASDAAIADAATADVATADAATVEPPPSATTTATAAPVCDEDKDGVLKGGSACVPPNGAQADCDDTDARIHPNADFQDVTWPAASPHVPANDWNCDGTVTKELPSGITCASLGGSDCTEGFATDIACGTAATYNICKKVIPLLGAAFCAVDHTETRTQACR